MGIIEIILVMILIANDFSFGQIMLIGIIRFPLFYGLVLPMIYGGTKGISNIKSNNKYKSYFLLKSENILSDCDNGIGIGLKGIKDDLIRVINKTSINTLKNIFEKGDKEVEKAIYNIILGDIDNKFLSGLYHLPMTNGVLNRMMGGDELLEIYIMIVEKSVDNGFINKTQKNNLIKNIKYKISITEG